MKTICSAAYSLGDRTMEPDDCWTVATFIQQKSALLDRPLDLRLLINGFKDFLLFRVHGGLHWHKTLAGRMKGAPPQYRRRQERSQDEAAIAQEIHQARGMSYEDRVAAWHKKTGKSRSSYDRALRR